MTLVNMQYEERFVSSSAEIFHRHGITLALGHDFEEYRELLKEARPEHTLGAPYDPKLHHMDANNALWMIGRNEAGRIVHTQASRILDLGPLTVGDYFLNHFREFPPSNVGTLTLPRWSGRTPYAWTCRLSG